MIDNIFMEKNFRELYNPENWFKHETLNAIKPQTNKKFILTSATTLDYNRVDRYMLGASHKGEQYVVCDTYEPTQPEDSVCIKVFTHVFDSVNSAREGFFYLLWGAERLQSRDEGAMVVGDVSYGRDNYCCFLRNNIAIRVMTLSRKCAEIPKTFVERIDQHIMEQSK